MKIKSTLQRKTTFTILILVLSLSLATVTISYYRYSESFEAHYINLTTDLARTAASIFDGNDIEPLRDRVMELYWENPAPSFDTEEEMEDYFAKFQEIVDDTPEYQDLLDNLFHFKDNYQNLEYIYLSYMDPETMTAVYLVDADDTEFACPTGTWDIIYPENHSHMESVDQHIPAFVSNSEEFGALCSTGVSIRNDQGEIVAHLFIDMNMNEIIQEGYRFLTVLLGGTLSVTLLITLFANFWMGDLVVKPIKKMVHATNSYIEDQKNDVPLAFTAISQMNIRTGDEMEELSFAIKKMDQDIENYIENITEITAEKERIGAELNVATHIQSSMLPRLFPAFPDREEFDLYATMTPAKEVGGDFYDFFLIDQDHLCLSIADVSGKGIPAALFMVIAKTMLKNAAQSGLSPKEILEKVNNQLCENNEAGMFVTVWLGILEISTGKMLCSNAGHEYPAIRRANGKFELFKEKHGFVLAGMEDSPYPQYEVQLCPEDVFYLYTDGVVEGTDIQNGLFGSERMLAALNRDDTNDPEILLSRVAHELAEFVGGAPQFDDITMLGFRYQSYESKKINKEEVYPKMNLDNVKVN